ncbi:MAG: hypothetical protein E7241_11170 [Lachnospiraceae bacterium]|nr:hypothetical protein [Lachnospiraceae bacterium]
MKKPNIRIPNIKDILLSVVGAMLCGVGCGFINSSQLGFDAIGLFYDGIRALLNLSTTEIGTASYIVCAVLTVFLLIVDRKYVSIGSLIYIIFYGAFANLGSAALAMMIPEPRLAIQILIAALGLLLLYVGISIYITIDIGVDVFTGVTLWLNNITGKPFKLVKIIFDLAIAVSGYIMGGTFGVLTLVTVVAGGPCVDFLTKRFQKIYFKEKINF